MRYLLISVIFIAFIFLASPKAFASEGMIELRNVNQPTSKCFALSSVINRTATYQILTVCKDLIYPLDSVSKFYIVWAVPLDPTLAPIWIGDLELGNKVFTVRNAFSSLFVTKEQIQKPKTPSEQKVMEGQVTSIPFLVGTSTPTPIPPPTHIFEPTDTPSPKKTIAVPSKTKTTIHPSASLTASPEASITPKPQVKITDILLTITKIILIIIIFGAIIATIVFFIIKFTRSRS